MFSRSWVSWLMWTAFLYASMKYQRTHGRCNCVFFLRGKKYNITSLQSKNDTPRFTIEYQGYMYSYNPCRSFHFVEEPTFGDCHDDMAMCYWVKDRMYEKIAEQSKAVCGFNEWYKMPMVQYTGHGMVMRLGIVSLNSSGIQKTTVLLNCDQTSQQANFEAVNTSEAGEFVFKLTHKCACPNACVISPSGRSTKKPTETPVPTTTVVPSTKPTSTDSPGDPDNVVVPVVASVAGVFGIVIFPIVIWQLLCKRDNRERQHLLDQNRGEAVVDNESVNPLSSPSEGSELTSRSGRSSASLAKPSSPDSTCSDITVPNKHKKDNLNKEINTYAYGLC
ncbi:uncharacterized protein LOC144656026 isoform X1 [Oculina patagonica]